MTPPLASALTISFIFYLFRRDRKRKESGSATLWLPLIWLLIICTRQISEWLQSFNLPTLGGSLEDGSPLDAVVYFTLILAGLRILALRRVGFSKVTRYNQALVIFLIYCSLAVLWSDFPLVSFKRWIKILGHPIMALVLLTEMNPRTALIILFKRAGYIIVPVSILFIKYYPALGRGFSEWTGQGYNTGITQGKNALGCDCLILGFFYVWYFLQVRKLPRSKEKRSEYWLCLSFIGMTFWLLENADSKTSLVAALVGLAVVIFAGMSWVNRRHVLGYVIASAIVISVANWAFDLSGSVLSSLGRDPTLTDRTYLWQDVLKVPINPLLGAGFESFWLGERLKKLWAIYTWRPNEAHNGYLETYLNLGLVGLFLLFALLLDISRRAQRSLIVDFEWGRFRIGFLAATIVYNWTEASFKAIHPMFLIFYIISLDYAPRSASEAAAPKRRKGLLHSFNSASVKELAHSELA